jgi:general secretion pathway protein D
VNAVEDDGRDAAARPRIVADEAKNVILIEATHKDYTRFLRVIETLDVVPNQVVLETTIAEVTLNDDLKFGLQWYFKDKKSAFTFSNNAAGTVAAAFPGFSYTLTAANVALALSQLSQVTEVNIVSQPSLTVLDNKKAVLQIGDQVPITTQSAVSTATAGAPVINSVSYRDTGVILSVTPQVNESGRVTLDIEQEVSSVANTVSSGIDSPTIRQRRIKTTVAVSDGEALALGGLIQKSKSKTQSKIPLLGDIPGLGNLFRTADNKIDKTELIIFITPRVIRSTDEARQVTSELQREFTDRVGRDRDWRRRVQQTIHRAIE